MPTATQRIASSRNASRTVTCEPPAAVERLVKSVERVRDLGEVYTPAATVKAMLDLLPETVWAPHPSATFLEPACGDGNFLVAILERKLERVARAWAEGALAAGADRDALTFHALEALASIYAVDISAENVVGGTPGHELGARTRLLEVFAHWYWATTGKALSVRSKIYASASWIVERNVQVGNMLPTNADGSPSGRDHLPLVEYAWDASTTVVSVVQTTMGAVTAAGSAETTGVLSLFDQIQAPVPVWSGPPYAIRMAPIAAPSIPNVQTRNGNGTTRR